MNRQLRDYLERVATSCLHATTDRIMPENFYEEFSVLRALPCGLFDTAIRLHGRLTRDDCMSVESNYYSVLYGTRRHVLNIETMLDWVCIHDDRRIIALHMLSLERKQRSMLSGQWPRRPELGVHLLHGHVVAT